MTTPNNNLAEKIAQLVELEDITNIDALYDKLISSGSDTDKALLAEAYIDLVHIWLYDFDCGKLNGSDDLLNALDWVNRAGKLAQQPYHNDRGYIYECLSQEAETPTAKLNYQNQAISEYRSQCLQAPEEPAKTYVNLARALFINAQLEPTQMHSHYEAALSSYVNALNLDIQNPTSTPDAHFQPLFIDFLYDSYRLYSVENIPSAVIDNYHEALEKTLKEYTHKNEYYHYWIAYCLNRLLTNEPDAKDYPESIKQRLHKKFLDHLDQITHYTSTSEYKLCALGHLFADAAKQKKNIHYHQIALKYYLAAATINPPTWCNHTYAGNTLTDLALLYIENGNFDKAKQAFQQGDNIYSSATAIIGEDFTLSLNFAEFMFDMAKHLPDANKDTLFERAKQQLNIALHQGNNFYDQPYILLIKIALAQGELNECLRLVKECQSTFSNNYYSYSFDSNRFRNDPDLTALFEEPIFSPLIKDTE